MVRNQLNDTDITKTWPALRAHVLLLVASWITFSMLLGLIGSFHMMESGGKEVVTEAIIHAVKTFLIVSVTGLLIAGVPVVVLIKRLR